MLTQSLTCHIIPPPIHYTLDFRQDLLENCQQLAEFVCKLGSKIAIISNSRIGPLYGEALNAALNKLGLESFLFILEEGEAYKTRLSKQNLEDQLFEKKMGRDTCLIALGGGVVMDIAGFIASTYCRGIPLVMIPTSLLGMVDASIGGKTAVNLPYGKNLIGTIYQPNKVLIDVSFLKTLPLKELINGFAEIIKHALIADKEYFHYLNEHVQALLELDLQKIEQVIYVSCKIKKQIVELDEKETGMRHVLNFGHTIAHALEKLSHYTLSHGEAIAIGIAVESYLAHLEGYLKQSELEAILKLMQKFKFPFQLPREFSCQKLMEAMNLDKKARSSQARFVLIDGIGKTVDFDEEYCTLVSHENLNKALQWMSHDLCCDSGTLSSRDKRTN